jgi:hypothetical protein
LYEDAIPPDDERGRLQNEDLCPSSDLLPPEQLFEDISTYNMGTYCISDQANITGRQNCCTRANTCTCTSSNTVVISLETCVESGDNHAFYL